MKTLLIILIGLSSCSGPVILTYSTASRNCQVANERNLFAYHKGYLTQTTIKPGGLESKTYDLIWYGDSIRYDDYDRYRRSNQEFVFKLDTTNNCLIITGKTIQEKYCK